VSSDDASATDVLYLVPVLPLTDLTDGLPLATARLHGRPLFTHAVHTLHEAGGVDVLVTAPLHGGAAVREELDDDPRATVVQDGETLGQALLSVLSLRASGESDEPLLVVHDPRCPLVPAAFVREVVARAGARDDGVVVGTRPMTDTVKSVMDGVVQRTVDRERLVVLASPLVMRLAVLRRLAEQPQLAECADLDDVVSFARAAGVGVEWAPAPGLAWRVDDAAGVSVLESLTDGGNRPRQ
jgi:2-C-methyl-D-erythritol 4-phosphate cytidylyltransferase